MRLRLLDIQVVGPAEQGEEVLRVVEEERQPVRALAGEDRGHGSRGPLVHGRCIPKPGRVLRQPGEVGIARRVELSVCPEQRDGGKLVEDDHDDRRSGGGLGQMRLRRGLEEPRHGREGEKEDEDEDRGYADDGQKHARGARTHVQERAEAADPRGRSDCPDPDPTKGLQGEERHQRREEGEMEHGGDPIAGQAAQRFDAEEEERGEEDDCEREENDVPARRPAHREKLDVPREEVEERLRDRQRRESGEVDRRPAKGPGRVRRPESHGRESACRKGGLRGARRGSAPRASVRTSLSRSRGSPPAPCGRGVSGPLDRRG